MNYPSLLCIIILAFMSCGHPKVSAESDDTTSIRLDSVLTPYVKALMAGTDNPCAIAIGVTKGEKVIYEQYFGLADITKKVPANAKTLFHLASVSKPFTAAAVVKLAQQGKLNLDDKLVEYLPELQMEDSRLEEITIRQVLSHSSGIPRHISSDDWSNPSYDPESVHENIQLLKAHQLDVQPGTEFSYSNAAYDIMGSLIARVSGKSYAAFLQSEVFEPLGMQNSTAEKQNDLLPPHWAQAHSYSLESVSWSPFPYNARTSPSSGIHSTLPDMMRWGMFHVQGGKHDGGYPLGTAYYSLMCDTVMPTPWGQAIGLGWFLQEHKGRPNLMHQGMDTGFEAYSYIYPEDSLSITVLSNRDFSRAGRIALAAAEVAFDMTPRQYELSARYTLAKAYKEAGAEKAFAVWDSLRVDSLDRIYLDDEDLLTAGAVAENAGQWTWAIDMLELYLEIDTMSNYAQRLRGNAYLGLQDSSMALRCYEKALAIAPDYQKAKDAIERIR